MNRAGDWLIPDGFPAGVGAVMTTREGGVSSGAYASMNLGSHVGDDADRVAHNRARLATRTGARPVYLEQVHGTAVAVLDATHAEGSGAPLRADAAVTRVPGVACCVMTADCLPVLLATRDGRAVGAAHAGWRGLSAGVIEAAVARLCDQAGCPPTDVIAWLGPCIGPDDFEVGPDVLQAFGPQPDGQRHFRPGRPQRWLADLQGLARQRLMSVGVASVGAMPLSTVGDARFYSFRRDGQTGRMAACIWIRT